MQFRALQKPASSASEDVSFYGSAAADVEVKNVFAHEIVEGRLVGMAHLGRKRMEGVGAFTVLGSIAEKEIGKHVRVVT